MLALLAAQPTRLEHAPRRRRRSTPAVAELARGFAAYRAGDYHAAVPSAARRRRRRICAARTGRCSCSAESEFYDGDYRGARDDFEKAGARARPPRADGAVPDRRLPLDGGRPRQGRRPATRAWPRPRRRAPATSRSRASASPSRPPSATTRRGAAQAVPRHRARLPGASAGRRGAAPDRRRHARAAADGAAAPPTPQTTPPTAPPAADLAPADRLKRAESLSKDRHWDEALAELGQAARDAAARSRRRARLPDRHDEVPHAPRLPDGGRAAAGRGRPPVGRQGGVGAVPRRARAVARRSRRRGDRRLPQGDRAVPALALRGRGAVPVGLARVQPRALPREPARRFRRRWTTSAAARSPTTPPGAWRSRTSCSATRRGRGRLRSLRAPAADGHRVRRDRRRA